MRLYPADKDLVIRVLQDLLAEEPDHHSDDTAEYFETLKVVLERIKNIPTE